MRGCAWRLPSFFHQLPLLSHGDCLLHSDGPTTGPVNINRSIVPASYSGSFNLLVKAAPWIFYSLHSKKAPFYVTAAT
ncbi:hypothetical protein DFH06DRAFT_1187341 [Mycena polygramma]|nr:hypothetical protein DFH06DRAFT_1187341 [Mycena polygramma]